MKAGNQQLALTSISMADADSVTVRGLDLANDLIGRLSFTEYFYFLVTGKMPSVEQTVFLDALLVTVAENGLMPTSQVARITFAADPGSLHGAVAAGILGCGPGALETSEACGAFLVDLKKEIYEADHSAAHILRERMKRVKEAGGRVPGFGHPIHTPVDPRTVRLFELVAQHGVPHTHVTLAKQVHYEVGRLFDPQLAMNVSMAMAAILLDLDFPVQMIKSIPILARTGALLAHLAEERKRPIGAILSAAAEGAIRFERDDKGL